MLARKQISPYILILMSFLIIILIGGTLLSLPISTIDKQGTRWLDGIFMATSSICITGLTINDVGSVYNLFGKTLILIFIQIGALGIVTISTMIVYLISKKMSYGTKILLKEDINAESTFRIQDYIKQIFKIIFFLEVIGALFLFVEFIQKMPFLNAIYYAIFHSISAFCNAGFSLFPNSLMEFQGSIIINIIIPILAILGGIGFSTLINIYRYLRKEDKRLTLNTKIGLKITTAMFIIATILIFIFEYNNAETMGNFSLIKKISASFFQSVSIRTAGFYTISLTNATIPTILLYMAFMFVGASPGSTAGGVKTTTVGVILAGIVATLRNADDIETEGRRISWINFNRAIVIVFTAILYIVFVALILSVIENDKVFLDLLFELMSAFGTTGITRNVTFYLKDISKILIIITMFIGRVGPLTMGLALSNRIKKKGIYRYPEENILIG